MSSEQADKLFTAGTSIIVGAVQSVLHVAAPKAKYKQARLCGLERHAS